MLTQTQIDVLKKHPGLGWISALRSRAIRRLLADGTWSERISCPYAWLRSLANFPGERLMACCNPQLAEQRRLKRQELLAATQAELEALAASVARPGRPPEKAADIGVRAGTIINQYKMSKHFSLTIRDGHLASARQREGISKTKSFWMASLWSGPAKPPKGLAADDGVPYYKRLALVEQAFRCVKGIDLLVRPIHHRTADRVQAHILLCLLAFLVVWHLGPVSEPLLFEDEELTEDRRRRDPVAPNADDEFG